mmetsp:Transcript_24016/g.95320  ORF Transcript_24016/g.95320 Transcript_24016/m.95320 type:complete len:255 (+) Transcript_24016:1336-2100(+)
MSLDQLDGRSSLCLSRRLCATARLDRAERLLLGPLKHAAVDDPDALRRPPRPRARLIRGPLDHLEALDDAAENDVAAVEVRTLFERDEELARVGVGAAVGHRDDARAGVAVGVQGFVGEGAAVDRGAARAVAARDVAALDHEAGDDAVKGDAAVAHGGARRGAERAKVRHGPRALDAVERDDDARRCVVVADAHVEEDAVRHGRFGDGRERRRCGCVGVVKRRRDEARRDGAGVQGGAEAGNARDAGRDARRRR